MDDQQFCHRSYERWIRESIRVIESIFARPEHGYMPKMRAILQLVDINELLEKAAEIAKPRAL